MKKLLFITWSISYGYGTEKSLSDVLNRMDFSRYEISILPLFKNSDNVIFKEQIHILEALIDYTQKNFDEQSALKNYYDLLANPLLFYKRIPENYDCIIACNHNAPSYFASYLKGGRKILWIRGDMKELDYRQYPENSKMYRQIRREYEMQARVLACFDSIAVISDVVKKNLEDLFGIHEHVVKISNSVDSERLIARSRESIPPQDKRFFVTLGRLDYNKNQILLLKAARELRKTRADFRVYLLGDGEDKEKLNHYIEENHLSDTVSILGFVENPYPYIKNSVATVLTSFSEGFSLVLVESVVLNTPILTTEVGIARELVEKYNCGELIGYDEKELADAMNRYLDRYDGYKDIFSIGKEYDIASETEKTQRLIEETLRIQPDVSRYKKLPYPETSISEYELDSYEVSRDRPCVLRVWKDGVPYEYLLYRKSGNDQLIVFHNGAVEGGDVTVPVFQRHSWAEDLTCSAIYCMDPTLYLNRYLQVGWGIGKNDQYYLENSSHILKTLIRKMEIRLSDTVLYGTSAGGYMAILMGIFLKGTKVVADNAQLDLKNWMYKDALDAVVSFCFDSIGDALSCRERFSVVDAFEKYHYVPPVFLHVNLCSKADNSTQLVPFLEQMEVLRSIEEYHPIRIFLHYAPEKGHGGISKEETLQFLYSVLEGEEDEYEQKYSGVPGGNL